MLCIALMTSSFSVLRSTRATELSPSQHDSTFVYTCHNQFHFAATRRISTDLIGVVGDFAVGMEK
jgi:hypothetical protein